MDFRDRSTLEPPTPRDWADRDQGVVLPGVSWEQYIALSDAREKSRPLMAYLDGALEIMTTSSRHEWVEKTIARLVEAYAEEVRLSLVGYGNTTFRKKLKRAGAEPDECYTLGKLRRLPDLVVEVVFTSGGIDKLEVYRASTCPRSGDGSKTGSGSTAW